MVFSSQFPPPIEELNVLPKLDDQLRRIEHRCLWEPDNNRRGTRIVRDEYLQINFPNASCECLGYLENIMKMIPCLHLKI